MRRRDITISNYRVPRFSIAGKLREIGGRVLSPTTRDSRISSAMPTVAEYGDCFVHGLSLSLSLIEAWTRGGWLKRATIGGGVEYEKRMGSAGVGCE